MRKYLIDSYEASSLFTAATSPSISARTLGCAAVSSGDAPRPPCALAQRPPSSGSSVLSAAQYPRLPPVRAGWRAGGLGLRSHALVSRPRRQRPPAVSSCL